MEFGTIKRNGYEFNVIFNGSHYYFFNSYCGLACIASRDYNKTDHNEHTTFFTLYVGNDNLLGGSITDNVMVSIAKRYINKAENKYLPVKVTYEEKKAKLHNFSVSVKALRFDGSEYVEFEG